MDSVRPTRKSPLKSVRSCADSANNQTVEMDLFDCYIASARHESRLDFQLALCGSKAATSSR